jgi:hypothetical protein
MQRLESRIKTKLLLNTDKLAHLRAQVQRRRAQVDAKRLEVKARETQINDASVYFGQILSLIGERKQ